MRQIMVVDDEPDTQLLFEQRFRREIKANQIKLTFFFSAETALEFLKLTPKPLPELILSDINMPGIGGLELLRQTKDLYQNILVIMVTAYNDEQNHRSAIANGADGYISKPIDFKALKTDVLGL